MNKIAQLVNKNSRLSLVCMLLAVVALALIAGKLMSCANEVERLAMLDSEAERRSIEIMSQTMNGKLIGSAALLGLIDADIKREARGELLPNSPSVERLLATIARFPDVDGALVVGNDGIIKSSVAQGKSSTGSDVKFRPYFEMAMKGKESVYAAVGTTSGRRQLYFAAPLHAGETPDTPAIGAVVARASLEPIDKMLSGKAGIALLLSPQGVVFAGSRAEWIGYLAGAATPERMKAIRDLKQFGNMFEAKEPNILPIGSDDGLHNFDGRRFAVVSAKVQWNDPHGDWKLLLIEDLSRTVPAIHFKAAAVTGVLSLLIMLLILLFLRSHYAQMMVAREGREYAAALELSGKYREQLSHLSLQLQQTTETAGLGQVFLAEAHKMLGMLQGIIYAFTDEDEQTLRLIAQYACRETPPAVLALGAGLLGQCALERSTKVIDTDSGDLFAIRSGLGETLPAAVIMTPILLNNRLLGVMEIATLVVPGQAECELFEEMAKLLAINLEIVGRSERTEAALAAEKQTKQKLERLDDAERFNRLAQDREQRILELKGEVNKLCAKLGQAEVYSTTLIETVGEHHVDLHPDYRSGDYSWDEQPPELGDLVDLSELQKLFSSFCDSIGIAAAIIDLKGNVLASSRWQRACTDFHRVNAESCARCIESDTELALKLNDGADFTMYTCKNGLTDCASPIILDRRHLANVFIGQFHLNPPDLPFFAEQARLFGYPEAEYLKAVNEAPVMDEQRLPTILGFLTGFARMVASIALAKHRADEAQVGLERQAKLLKSERVAAMSLAEDAERARRALEAQNKESNL